MVPRTIRRRTLLAAAPALPLLTPWVARTKDAWPGRQPIGVVVPYGQRGTSGVQALCSTVVTPPAIVNRMNAEIEKILATPNVAGKVDRPGLVHSPNTSVQFAEFNRAERAKWAKIVRDANIRRRQ